MSVQTCQDCRGLFSFLPRGVCGECLEARETSYQTVRDFLRDNPRARMAEIVDETEVDQHLIELFIREGRLQLASAAATTGLTCEVCDAAIADGRHCAKCHQRLTQQFVAQQTAAAATEAPDPRLAAIRSGMHTRRGE